jgi:aminoglycoside phosphotransferase (APT) family kinase protein
VFATALADFLAEMYRIDPAGGPPPGPHNFFRGGPLAVYDTDTRNAIAALGSEIKSDDATELWEAALGATWHGSAVWIHGDVSAENLLVDHGRLSAVIDFGCSAVGDPACDLTIAWTFLSRASRDAFQARLPLDAPTWARGRGWALWKALITFGRALKSDPERAASCRRIIEEVIAEQKRAP